MQRVIVAVLFVLFTLGIPSPRLNGQGTSLLSLSGLLAAGDTTLRTGEYCDEHSFEGQAGQSVTVVLTTTQFNPYLMVIAPSGEKKENDDFAGSKDTSQVMMTLTETGRYRVLVTSYEQGETGSYRLRVEASGAATATPGMRVESGRLASGDRTIQSGEYADEYTFQGRRGERVTVDLRSDDFDPFVILMGPTKKVQENDDHEGDPKRSLVSVELPEEGAYRVLVTSYEKGETGDYELRIQQGTADAAPSAAVASAAAGPHVERGSLAATDQTLKTGEYMDTYTFEGQVGQRVTLDVVSQQFDTYLILIPPRGDRHENDDASGKPGHSIIEADITEPGTYKVIVTSYEKGSTGSYELNIGLRAQAAAPAGPNNSRDIETIAFGEPRDGRLSESDGRLEKGEYRDIYAFQGEAGERIVVELASTEFDPYLIVDPPEGQSIDNDDADGRQDLSRIEMPLRTAGRYRIVATSYEGGKSGSYRLTLRRAGTGPATATPTTPSGARPSAGGVSGRRVFGVFVGISAYGGRANDLKYTADDARRVNQAMIRGGGMREADGVLLVDQQATVANIRRALENAARQAGPNDMFVFFHSGHGGRVPRTTFQAADPDGYDETVSFYDADVTDDDMSEWLANVRAGVTLIVLDSCFSGGFSKDVITAKGRMGLFSSEEDVTSMVADKFRAGGFLAQFIGEAVGDNLADEDNDGETTAVELSQYVHDRYRADVKSGGEDASFVMARMLGYQHLVVDRGGVGPYDVLFRGTRRAGAPPR